VVEQEFQEKTKQLIDDLKATCARNGLGNDASEFKIITQVFLYKLLNDKFGIQTRGGCSCAGTYGHYLLNIDPGRSKHITDMIDQGDYSEKPGWMRLSLHPTMTDQEVKYIGQSIVELAENHQEWREEYNFDPACLELVPKGNNPDEKIREAITQAITKNFLT
jgi:selenocysteine lyase/cysteine desulfurase